MRGEINNEIGIIGKYKFTREKYNRKRQIKRKCGSKWKRKKR
jgi:hypothetical protein